jgi:hypothetical protein
MIFFSNLLSLSSLVFTIIFVLTNINWPEYVIGKQSGMAGGLETLAGQAYGAKQYQKLGTYTYSAIISLIIMCPPICVLWIFIGKLLPLLGQDTSISQEACKYSMYLIPALFGRLKCLGLVEVVVCQWRSTGHKLEGTWLLERWLHCKYRFQAFDIV